MDQVEIVEAVTSVKYHPGTGILHRKTTLIKFNCERIFTSKTANPNKVFNEFRRNKNIRHNDRSRSRRGRCMTNMCNGKRGTVTDDDAGRGVDRKRSGEVTSRGGHVSGSPDVHVPISTTEVDVAPISTTGVDVAREGEV